MRFNEKTKFRFDNFAGGGLVSASLSHSHKKVDIPPSVRWVEQGKGEYDHAHCSGSYQWGSPL